MNFKLYAGALALVMLGGMASCSSDLNDIPESKANLTMKLAGTPELYAWSGHQDFSGSSKARANVDGQEVPNAKYLTDEVEINLSINDVHTEDGAQKYEVADLVSKLSIHVRSAKDVNVFIPVPKDYYCDQDDLYIFNKHGELFAYGRDIADNKSTLSFEVGEVGTVTLTVEFQEEGISVSTTGVTEEVLEYCRETYGDGMNFEVYNYYNRSNMPVVDEDGVVVGGPVDKKSYAEWTLSELKTKLDNTTVTFGDVAPDYYVNAFTGNITKHNGATEYRDCYVTPKDNHFDAPYYDFHFNGYDQNVVYKNVDVVVEVPEGQDAPVYEAANDNRFGQGKAPVAAPEEVEPTE